MDVPSLSFALAVLLLHPQIYFGIRYRTWLYLFSMSTGMLLQIVAYVARVQHSSLVERVAMAMAPAFFGAAIHCSVFWVAEARGLDEVGRYKKRFMVLDSMALAIQGVGGTFTCGRHGIITMSILQAGLAWWLTSTLLIMGIAGKVAWTANTRRNTLDGKRSALWESGNLGWFLGGESLVFWLKSSVNAHSPCACKRMYPCKDVPLHSGDEQRGILRPCQS
jgi:hypothetical protein